MNTQADENTTMQRQQTFHALTTLAAGAAALVMAFAAPQAQAATPSYRLTLLDDLPGGANSAQAQGLNNLGTAVGQGQGPDFLATMWQPGQTSATSLGDLAGGIVNSHAYAINDGGQVVGTSSMASGTHAFVWRPGQGMKDLGDLPGGDDASGAYSINSAGFIVGYSYATSDLNPRAVVWDPVTLKMTQIGDLPGGANNSVARDINDSNVVVGVGTVASGQHAFRWSAGGGMVDLGDLPGGMDWSMAYAVNEQGWIAGSGVTDYGRGGAGVQHAVLWGPDGHMLDLGVLSKSYDTSTALGINDRGEVIGTSSGRPFLWTASTGMLDVNTLVDGGAGFLLTDVWAINDKGQIAGWGVNASGARQAFLLTEITPVPEPGSPLLLAAGLAGVGFSANRRRKASAR